MVSEVDLPSEPRRRGSPEPRRRGSGLLHRNLVHGFQGGCHDSPLLSELDFFIRIPPTGFSRTPSTGFSGTPSTVFRSGTPSTGSGSSSYPLRRRADAPRTGFTDSRRQGSGLLLRNPVDGVMPKKAIWNAVGNHTHYYYDCHSMGAPLTPYESPMRPQWEPYASHTRAP